ncbi:VOC family protein [Nitrolancea hollandica]|uniref:Lactoylglutathione lyase family protein n=1 Tax=Nitrolancea hollandica Lb TaxID=1129897 RepID=I4EJ21_9BACT|nr:VOC family protein [Nitrolancea hollandica]CCF84683.1 Lactoylglutathione lyase family protein [Nitrolancea hollandica Lb]
MAISQVRLVVTDFDACFRFYRDVMGLHILWGEEGAQYAGFRLAEGASLTLFRPQPGTTVAETVPGQDRVVLIFSVEDLDGSVDLLKHSGARFVSGPADYPEWGVRAAQFRDPAGNLLELASPLPISLWSETLREAAHRLEQT